MRWWLFNDCRSRIARAEAHRDALRASWNSMIEDKSFEPVVNVDRDGRGCIRVLPSEDAVLDHFAFEFGEFLYQLRAALDGSIYAAAVYQTGQNPPPDQEKLQFPIYDSREQFQRAERCIKPLSDKCKAFIESVQPYNASEYPHDNANRTLGILNDWARKDRHRKLHLIGTWASDASPKLWVPAGCSVSTLETIPDGFLDDEGIIAKFTLTGYTDEMKIQANPDLMLDIAIDEPPPPCADDDMLPDRIEAMLFHTKRAVGFLENCSVG